MLRGPKLSIPTEGKSSTCLDLSAPNVAHVPHLPGVHGNVAGRRAGRPCSRRTGSPRYGARLCRDSLLPLALQCQSLLPLFDTSYKIIPRVKYFGDRPGAIWGGVFYLILCRRSISRITSLAEHHRGSSPVGSIPRPPGFGCRAAGRPSRAPPRARRHGMLGNRGPDLFGENLLAQI